MKYRSIKIKTPHIRKPDSILFPPNINEYFNDIFGPRLAKKIACSFSYPYNSLFNDLLWLETWRKTPFLSAYYQSMYLPLVCKFLFIEFYASLKH